MVKIPILMLFQVIIQRQKKLVFINYLFSVQRAFIKQAPNDIGETSNNVLCDIMSPNGHN